MSPFVLAFVVPGPPVPQARARSAKDGHHYTPAKSRRYAQTVASFAMSAASAGRWVCGTRGPFAIVLDVYRAERRGDWDNFGKACTDPLTKLGLWADDAYIEDAHVRLHVDAERPRVEMTVTNLRNRH